jgi:uncharacterized protein YbjT (DUF2867 family)
MQQHKTALLIGATGLTGGHLLEQLLAHPAYDQVIALVRRPMGILHPKLKESIIDFDAPDPALIHGDDLFCAMGTTLAKAGSKEAQYKIDCTYPASIGQIARNNGVKRYLLVSSVGADAQSANFYLRTKGDLEQQIRAMGFDTFVAARPSFLLGDRKEMRIGEKIGIVLSNLISPLLMGRLRKYRGIPSAQVAKSLIDRANNDQKGSLFPEYDELCG